MRITRSLTGLLAAGALALGAGQALGGEIALQNVDQGLLANGTVPNDQAIYPDRLVMNRVNKVPYDNDGVDPFVDNDTADNDTAVLRVRNTGATPLQITSLDVTAPFFVTGTSLPATIPAGGSLDLTVVYGVPTGTVPKLDTGTLRIHSDDADEPTTDVELAGLFQFAKEGDNEPSLVQMIQALGYKTAILNGNQKISKHGRLEAVGEEHLSAYWRKADPGSPVTVRQVASYHGPGANGIQWYAKPDEVDTLAVDAIRPIEETELSTLAGILGPSTIMRHASAHYQTMLPDDEDYLDLGKPASLRFGVRTFNPPAGVLFGFKVQDAWTDNTLNVIDITDTYCDGIPNNTTVPDANPDVCGHSIRFYPLRNRSGALVPDAWIMAMDFPNRNYDYNDNVYVLTNVEPEIPLDTDTKAPTVGTRFPAPNAKDVDVDADITAVFSEAVVLPEGDSGVTVTAGGVPVAGAVTLSANQKSLEFDALAPLPSGAQVTVTLSGGITDLSGNPLLPVTWSFTTEDSEPPVVSQRVPAADASGVATGQSVVVTFSEPVDEASAESAANSPLTAGGAPVAAARTLAADRRTLTIDPAGDLPYDTAHTVSLTGGIKDLAGNTLAPVTWTFRTTPPPDLTAPSVTGRSPAPGATGVPLGAEVEVAFSEPLAAASATASAARIVGPAGAVGATVSLGGGDATLRIRPSAALAAGTTYSVELRAGLTDRAGNALAPDSWSFTTAAPVSGSTGGTGGTAGGPSGSPAKPRFCLLFPAKQKSLSKQITLARKVKARATTRTARARASKRVTILTKAKRAQVTRYRKIC